MKIIADQSKKDIRSFLRDLARLSRRHGVYVHGCGCDGSPWLSSTVGGSNPRANNLAWDKDSGSYIVNE